MGEGKQDYNISYTSIWMKQKTLHALDGISDEYIKPLEVSSKPLAHEMMMSFSKYQNFIYEEGNKDVSSVVYRFDYYKW